MHIVLFYHSLVSDWNHGNAHFLRGIATELLARGHTLRIYEPADGWSRSQLVMECGEGAIADFSAAFPHLRSKTYTLDDLDLDWALDLADLVIVHEWNDPALVAAIGRHRIRTGRYNLLFHDTHHRSATAPDALAAYDLSGYDGVLAYGGVIRDLYERRGWTRRAWTWHEAADTRHFTPIPGFEREGDLIWIGNWGDDERAAELTEFLIEPARDLGLTTRVHGVRYPDSVLAALGEAGIEYGGWLPNYAVPEHFARFRVTVHVPRRPYVQALPGIPTIRVFEALACGIPLVSAPWTDCEGLFRPGEDYLIANDGAAMRRHLRDLLHDEAMACAFAARGLATIRARHTCAHRVDELMDICAALG